MLLRWFVLLLLLLQNGCHRYGCRGGSSSGECSSLCDDVISRQSTTQRQHNACNVLVLEINKAMYVKDDVGWMDGSKTFRPMQELMRWRKKKNLLADATN
jgi:hypothetical protein